MLYLTSPAAVPCEHFPFSEPTCDLPYDDHFRSPAVRRGTEIYQLLPRGVSGGVYFYATLYFTPGDPALETMVIGQRAYHPGQVGSFYTFTPPYQPEDIVESIDTNGWTHGTVYHNQPTIGWHLIGPALQVSTNHIYYLSELFSDERYYDFDLGNGIVHSLFFYSHSGAFCASPLPDGRLPRRVYNSTIEHRPWLWTGQLTMLPISAGMPPAFLLGALAGVVSGRRVNVN